MYVPPPRIRSSIHPEGKSFSEVSDSLTSRPSCLVVCARRASGTEALRALQLYHAPSASMSISPKLRAAMLAITAGAPPERAAGLKGKLVYRCGPKHELTAGGLHAFPFHFHLRGHDSVEDAASA
jgi:hypothetical protein